MKLTEIEFEREERWCWECPDCGDWNDETEDPDYKQYVICDGCYEGFKINE